MATYLCVKANNTTKKYEVKASANKPYMRVSTGYMALTTEMGTNTGLRVKVGGNSYRIVETYYTTINTTTSTSVNTYSTNTYSYNTTRSSQYNTSSTNTYQSTRSRQSNYGYTNTSSSSTAYFTATSLIMDGNISVGQLPNRGNYFFGFDYMNYYTDKWFYSLQLSKTPAMSASVTMGSYSRKTSLRVSVTTSMSVTSTGRYSTQKLYNSNSTDIGFSVSVSVGGGGFFKKNNTSTISRTYDNVTESMSRSFSNAIICPFIDNAGSSDSFSISSYFSLKTTGDPNLQEITTYSRLAIENKIIFTEKRSRTTSSSSTASRSSQYTTNNFTSTSNYTSSRQSDYTTNNKTSTSYYTVSTQTGTTSQVTTQ